MLTNHRLKFIALTSYVMFASALAEAQSASVGKDKFTLLLANPIFETTVTITLYMFAAFKWFTWIEGLSTQSALTSAITPAIITFIAFEWKTVLGWVGIA